jgi:4-amino-4-deoxy-L-arabinose transferase-like glycosyltransferase
MAGVLRVLPLQESSIRLATVLVAALGVGLLYLLAAAIFQSRAVAMLVAGVMALSPTYYIHGRLALSVLYPVPFTVLWLLLLHHYLSKRRKLLAAATGVVLGAGVYSYLAAAIMMPLYLLATIALLFRQGDRAGLTRVTAGFLLMLIPIALWQAVEPDRYANIVSAYRLFEDQPGVQPAPVVTETGRLIGRRVDTFWATLDPGTMFFTGESSLQISTREVGSVLTPVAVLLVLGLTTLRRGISGVIPPWLWTFGLVTAPLPAVIMADVEIRRWLVVLPFIAVIAGFGAARLLQGDRRRQFVLASLVALCLVQFGSFTRDFFGPYRERSSTWFGGNIRAAVVRVLDEARSEPPPLVYISSEIPWVDAYWQFYSLAKGQRELLHRTQYVRLSSGEMPAALSGAVLIAPVTTVEVSARLNQSGWDDLTVVPDLDGSPSLVVMRARR